jgi:hypothetical protein
MTATDAEAPHLRAMTFNLNGADGPADDRHAWPRRAPLAVAMIARYAPDVIGLQEVGPAALADLRQGLAGYAHVPGNRYGDAPPVDAIPICWRADRFALVDAGEFWLSRTPGVESADWGVPSPLGVTWVRLRRAGGALGLLHLNTHLEDGPDGARRVAAAADDLLHDRARTAARPPPQRPLSGRRRVPPGRPMNGIGGGRPGGSRPPRLARSSGQTGGRGAPSDLPARRRRRPGGARRDVRSLRPGHHGRRRLPAAAGDRGRRASSSPAA